MTGPGETVGLVVAAYNAEAHLAATLESLAAQDHLDWCCVVVDDGSTDGTSSISQAFSSIDHRFISVRQANAGVSAARNAGAGFLPESVRWLCFVDSDDLLLPGAIKALVGQMRSRPDAVGSSGWSELIDEHGHPVQPGRHRKAQTERLVGSGLRNRLLPGRADTTFASLVVRNTLWPPATVLLRRSTFDEVGGFATAMPQREDWDLWLRAARHGAFVFVDEQVAWYRRHGGNATKDAAESFFCRDVTIRRMMDLTADHPSDRRTIRQAVARDGAFNAFVEVRAALHDLRRGCIRRSLQRLFLAADGLISASYAGSRPPSRQRSAREAAIYAAVHGAEGYLDAPGQVDR